jgi:hypothetical protein
VTRRPCCIPTQTTGCNPPERRPNCTDARASGVGGTWKTYLRLRRSTAALAVGAWRAGRAPGPTDPHRTTPTVQLYQAGRLPRWRRSIPTTSCQPSLGGVLAALTLGHGVGGPWKTYLRLRRSTAARAVGAWRADRAPGKTNPHANNLGSAARPGGGGGLLTGGVPQREY